MKLDSATALKILGFKGRVVVTQSEIKAKYRKMSKKLHPDADFGDADRFKNLVRAFEVASGISEGCVIDLSEVVCDIKQGSDLFSYVVRGKSVSFTL